MEIGWHLIGWHLIGAPHRSSWHLIGAPHRKLAGGKNAYRIRHGDYRVLYEVVEVERRIVVVKIGRRREVYR